MPRMITKVWTDRLQKATKDAAGWVESAASQTDEETDFFEPAIAELAHARVHLVDALKQVDEMIVALIDTQENPPETMKEG